jgi:hypothetical protein
MAAPISVDIPQRTTSVGFTPKTPGGTAVVFDSKDAETEKKKLVELSHKALSVRRVPGVCVCGR